MTPLIRLSSLSVLVSLFASGCLVAGVEPDEIDIAEDGSADEAGGTGGDEGITGDGETGGNTGDGDSTGTSDGGTDTTGDGDSTTGDTTGGDDGFETGETGLDTGTDTSTDTGEPVCNDIDDVVLYLSPDDSNSMSSPVQVRERVLTEGSQVLSGVPVRVWEFMNYYGFDYPAAADGELALYAAAQPVMGEDARWQLQLAVSSEIMTPDERPPMNVTLVLDTSGSMAGEPFELLRETCYAIASQLQVGDTVSMVEWDVDDAWTLAGYPVVGPDDPMLVSKIDALEWGGGTNLNGGLTSGYNLAQMVYEPDALNRIVLISDGGANAGVTEVDLIAENAEYGGSDGVYLVGVGVAKDSNYNDELMDVVTDAGKGASVFLPDNDEVWKVFGDNFENTMAIAARNVQVELTMPPGFEIVKFSGEEFSGDPQEVDPQHLAPNDTMVFHQQVETCAPELATEDAKFIVKATWEDPWTFQPQELSQSWSLGDLTAMDPALLAKGAAVLAYAESMKAYKQAFTDDQKAAALQPALDAIAPAQMLQPQDQDLLEIAMILAALQP